MGTVGFVIVTVCLLLLLLSAPARTSRYRGGLESVPGVPPPRPGGDGDVKVDASERICYYDE